MGYQLDEQEFPLRSSHQVEHQLVVHHRRGIGYSLQ